MPGETWIWAHLDRQRLALVEEAEQTLGADIVIVYDKGDPRSGAAAPPSLRAADLDESQLECLVGLEAKVGGVAVAYRRSA
jgi:hypothetical protein